MRKCATRKLVLTERDYRSADPPGYNSSSDLDYVPSSSDGDNSDEARFSSDFSDISSDELDFIARTRKRS